MSKRTTKKLGQVHFEVPVFEADPDERIEELATTAHGPKRLAASARIRLDARAAQLRHRPETVPFEPETPAPKRVKRVTDPRKAPLNEAAWRSWSQGTQDNGLDQALAELDEERRPAGRRISGLRRRFAQVIDHWAEKETAVGLRLDQALFGSAREP
jgi:hypothetical protein